MCHSIRLQRLAAILTGFVLLSLIWACGPEPRRTSPTTIIIVEECGNGVAAGSEVCDGTDLRGQSCQGLALGSGTLRCEPGCSGFDTSQCEISNADATCDNGVAEPGEVCDGADLRGASCESLDFDGGVLRCRADCRGYDTTQCTSIEDETTCSDGQAEGREVCDGGDLRGQTCESLGLGSGTLGCQTNCMAFDTSGCERPNPCGNGIRDAPEVCDGDDLAGETCESRGFDSGTLRCLANCTGFDTSECNEAGPACDLPALTQNGVLDFNAETVTISGQMRLNGAQMPNNGAGNTDNYLSVGTVISG